MSPINITADPSQRMTQTNPQPRMTDPSAYNKSLFDKMNKAYQDATKKPPNSNFSALGNLTTAQKIQHIKTDFSFNPEQLDDPRDQINTVMYRWSKFSEDAQKHLLDYKGQKDLDDRAGQFYDKYLAPAYKRMGVPLFDRKKWIDNAYEIGKHYDLDYQYSDKFTYGARSDLYSLGGRAANLASSLTSLVGAGIALLGHKEITDENWQQQQQNSLKGGFSLKGFFQNAETLSDSQHLFDARSIRERLLKISNRMDIMDKLRPLRGFTENAGSFTMEALPFIALSAGGGPAIAESELTSLGLAEAPIAADAGIASRISSSVGALAGGGVRGRLAEAALKGGVEGAIYGTLTRPTQDKNRAVEDALGWAAGSTAVTAFSEVAGALIGRLGKRNIPNFPSDSKGEILPPERPRGPRYSSEAPEERALPGKVRPAVEMPDEVALESGKRQLQLAQKDVVQAQRMLTDGREPAGPFEQQELSEAGIAETIAEHGGAAQEIINNAAAAHIIKMEQSGLSKDQVFEKEIEMFKNGSRQDKDMLDAAMRIRTALGDKNLTGLSKVEKANLIVQLQTLTKNASAKMVKYLPGLQKNLRDRILSYPTSKLDLTLIKHLLPEVAQSLPQGATQAQVAEALKNKLADLTVAAHRFADNESTKDIVGDALKAEKQRAAFVKKNPPPSGWTERTRRTTSSKGEPGVSYSHNPAWIVYAKRAVKQAGKKWNNADITDWIKDLDEDDFAADIHSYFIPKFLKDIDLRFERRGSAGQGYDYSNLYAFAWNFKDKMPVQYAERLEEELMHSPKMSSFYDTIAQNKKLSPEKREEASLVLLRKQALAMFNHVGNFLNSGHFPKENHIFASTNSFANDPTIWMEQLFKEREDYENKIVDNMFKRGSTENQNAKTAIKVLMAGRRQAYKAGEQSKVSLLNEMIQQKLLQKGPRGGASKAEGKIIPMQRSMTMPPASSIPENIGPGKVVVDKSGKASLWLSPEFMDHFLRATGTEEQDVPRIGGVNISKGKDIQRMIKYNLMTAKTIVTKDLVKLDNLLLEAFSKAGPEGVSIMRATGDKERSMDVFHEEWTHGWQRALAYIKGDRSINEINTHLSDHHINHLYDTMPKGIKAYLDVLYPGVSKGYHVIEATAKLICFGPEGYAKHLEKYGYDISGFHVPEEEATNYLFDYFARVLEEHGPDALDKLTTAISVAKKLQEEILTHVKPGVKHPESSRLDIPVSQQRGSEEALRGP